MDPVLAVEEKERSARTLAGVVYGLYALSFFLGITAIVGVIINYLKKEDVAGTLAESHFRWQVRTFWFGLMFGVIGFLTFLVAIGWLILLATGVWVTYRIVKGALFLYENKPMYLSAR